MKRKYFRFLLEQNHENSKDFLKQDVNSDKLINRPLNSIGQFFCKSKNKNIILKKNKQQIKLQHKNYNF